jgi:hypothetical protein
MNQIHYVENDTAPDLEVTYEGVDLTGYGAITLHIGYPRPLVKNAEVVDAASGQIRFTWAEGDLRRGEHPAEIQVIDESGRRMTFTGLQFVISPEIA